MSVQRKSLDRFVSRSMAIMWLGGLLMLPGSMAYGDDLADKESPFLCKMHKHVSKSVVDAVELVDSFFGDKRLDEETRDTLIRVRPSMTVREGEGFDYTTKFSARVALPALEQRLQLIIDDFLHEEEEPANLSESEQRLREVEERDGSTGLRFIFSKENGFRLNLDGGVRFRSDPQLFGRVRASKFIAFDRWALRLTERVTLREGDGWRMRTEMNWNRPLENNWLFRSRSTVRIFESESGVKIAQSLSIFKQLNHRQALELALLVDGITQPNNRVEAYEARVTYRQLLYDNWLYFQVRPAFEFPRENDFDFTPSLEIALEVLFGDVH